ncbi:MAG: transcriptional regulator, MarR family [Caulobacteraceae bacterium]|nr:transcriptional regulator, MarR family [Caulobacteraceae bacterium]
MDMSRDFALLAALVSRRLRGKLKEYLPKSDITAVEWLALLWIDHAGGSIGQRQLAEKLELSNAPTTRLVQSLAERGLLTQEGSGLDRRSKSLTLTPASQPYLDLGKEIGARLRGRVFAGVSAEDLQTSLRVLRVLAERLE